MIPTTPLPPPPLSSSASTGQQHYEKNDTNASSSFNNSNSNTTTTHTTTTTTTTAMMIQEPPRLPLNTFAPKSLQLLATRQTHIPILVLATEAAHRMAWKNQLRLADLFEGLLQSSLANNNNNNNNTLLPPIRSLTRSLQLTMSQLPVTFVEADQLAVPMTDKEAQAYLQQQALLQASDGDLQHDLNILEDAIDSLLQDDNNHNNDTSDNHNKQQQQQEDGETHSLSSTTMQARQEHFQQVTKDAFALTSPLTIPWLWRYRQGLDATTNHLEHDLLQCPPLCLLVCTTQEMAGPLDTLTSLSSSHYLPPAYQNGLYDPKSMKKEVLVLHDCVDGPEEWNKEGSLRPHEVSLRQSLQAKFGAGAQVLRLNSIALETAQQLAQEETSDLWNGNGTRGNCLSLSDRAVIRKYLTTLVANSLLPAMERRVSDLNVIVSDRKKGVKNVFKSFWRSGKTKEDESTTTMATNNYEDDASSPSNSDIKYRYDSIESQTRLLADSLFLMRDYEAALSMYKLIKDDFKQDKAHAHYGSVLEQIALCMYLTDPYGKTKEIFGCVETALLSYSRAAEDERPASWGERPVGRPTMASKSTRLATRLCLVLIATRNICDDKHLEVGDLLASASSHETSLGAAVLLEQSSAHYFKAEMYRKYAFHMLMSGHMFRSAEQENHAFRCFTSALYIYRDSRWDELHNHLRSALAAQLYSLDRLALALQLYAKLVGSTSGGRVSAKSQQKFINHLLEICNENPKKALVGADRMAASSKVSSDKRNAVRTERLERIVQVVRYTKSASRVLELPNMTLPCIHDSTVIVIADETSHSRQDTVHYFGNPQPGEDAIWEELTLMANAELKASQRQGSTVLDEVTTSALAKVDDPYLQKYLAQIDKERISLRALERSRKSSSFTESPPVRALMEPITVDFAMSNPLGIPVDLSDIQLIARMTDDNGRVCTNEDAIKITPLVSYNESPEWCFYGSTTKFQIADFCRVSSTGGAGVEGKQSWKAAEETEPSFVVTKTTMTLDPESRKSVAISICPLTQGKLEILGVRCRLFDDVWVSHSFDLKGDLLQDNRSNRANRVRAEPTVLKAKIERGMPSLTAELIHHEESISGMIGPLLDGQLTSWTLRMSNVGTAAATNIFLKTNLPWISITGHGIESSGSAEEKESQPTHCCIGPTGTLMELPLDDNTLKTVNELHPNETVDIPIHIRTSGIGKEDFYMLFRYDLLDDDAETPRHRWLRKMFEISIYPSITFNASVVPSFSSPGEFIMSIDVANLRTDRPDSLHVGINKLSLASRCNHLELLPGQTEDGGPVLAWQEKTTLHVRVSASESTSNCMISECNLNVENGTARSTDAISSRSLDFVRLQSAHDLFDRTMKAHEQILARAMGSNGNDGEHPKSIAQIRRENTGSMVWNIDGTSESGPGHPTSLTRLCPRDDAKMSFPLICSWSSEDGSIEGQHFIQQVPICPPSANGSNGCPLIMSAKHPESVSADLSQGPAHVRFEVKVRNRLVNEPVSFEFNVDEPESFHIVGPERFKASLGGGDEMSVPLQAIIPNTGLYNLQSIRLTIESEQAISYTFPLQWMVTVDTL
jgi:hypothetical protein